MYKPKLIDEIGQFTAMPNWAIEMGETIGTDGLVLLMALRYHSGRDGLIFPDYDTLRKHSGLNRHQIARAIRQLEKLKIIERKKRFGQSTIYRVMNLLTATSSAESALLDETAPVVQDQHYSSAESALSVVPNMHSNKTHLTRSTQQEEDDDSDSALAVIATLYEKTFGCLITAMQADKLKGWATDYGLPRVKDALEKTALNNGRSLAYTERILMNKNAAPGKNGKQAAEQKDYLHGDFARFIEH